MTATDTQDKSSERTTSDRPVRLERLEAALIDARARLTTLEERPSQVEASTPPSDSTSREARVAACKQLVAKANGFAAEAVRSSSGRANEYVAWDCLGQADRQMVFLMNPAERTALWATLKAESASKLAGHRKEAVLELSKLGPERLDLAAHWESIKAQRAKYGGTFCEDDVKKLIVEAKKAAPSAETVCEVMLQIQTNSQNHYHKLGQLERQITYAARLLVGLVVLLIIAAISRVDQYVAGPSRTLIVGMLFGLIGGVLSLAFSTIRTDTRARIPSMRASFAVALVRPFIGAAIALPVIAIVEVNVIRIQGVEQLWLVAAASFLAGFSERWFLGLTERFERKVSDGH